MFAKLTEEEKRAPSPPFFWKSREELDIIPPVVRVLEVAVFPACPEQGGQQQLKLATLPRHPIAKSAVSIAILTWIIIEEVPLRLRFSGYLQTDGYVAYGAVCKQEGITQVLGSREAQIQGCPENRRASDPLLTGELVRFGCTLGCTLIGTFALSLLFGFMFELWRVYLVRINVP